MDVGLAIFLGVFAFVAPIALDQFGQTVRKFPEVRREGLGPIRRSQLKVRKGPVVIGIGLAVLTWAIAIPVALSSS